MTEDAQPQEEMEMRGTSGAENAQANYSRQQQREQERRQATATPRAARAAGRGSRSV